MVHPIEFDPNSTATNPGGLEISNRKLRQLEPSMFGWRRILRRIVGAMLIVDVLDLIDRRVIKEHLAWGDARAAVVVSTSPLLVAAYSDVLDCVVMLRFPLEFAARYDLKIGSQLVTVNTYYSQMVNHQDLTFGPNQFGDWSGFFPLIAEFISDDLDRIEQLKLDIYEDEWQRCQTLGDAYRDQHRGVARIGRPRRAHQPAGFMKKIVIGTIIGIVGIVAFILVAWNFL